MNPLLVPLILICAANIPHEECTVDNATDVLVGADSNTPMQCIMSGQALVASTALSLEGQYIKIVCNKKEANQ